MAWRLSRWAIELILKGLSHKEPEPPEEMKGWLRFDRIDIDLSSRRVEFIHEGKEIGWLYLNLGEDSNKFSLSGDIVGYLPFKVV